MTRIYSLEQIRAAIDPLLLIQRIEAGFVAYSEGKAVVPPVGHLDFEEPPGECHIKSGYVVGADHFVIKVATGFYDNPAMGLPSGSGLMLVFGQKTGRLEAILLDEGWLTDIRTAAAGAVAAKWLAPRPAEMIGIVGTGTQARLQLEWLRFATDCRRAMVWGRSAAKAELYGDEMGSKGFAVRVAESVTELCARCDLIVTTTPSREPLLLAEHVQPGTHITALGADGGGKQELAPELVARADLCVVDSIAQCREYGDVSHALRSGVIGEERLIEIGRVIGRSRPGRTRKEQITIADLTGVAVQDVQAAALALERL